MTDEIRPFRSTPPCAGSISEIAMFRPLTCETHAAWLLV